MTEPTYIEVGSIDDIEDKADLITWYDNQSAWLENKHNGDIAKSLYSWMPYIFVLLFIKYKKAISEFRPDFIDKIMAGICLFSSVITTCDYLTNLNLRPMWMDWTVLGGALLVFFMLKLRKIY